jgi:hypothetical protein
MRKLGPPSKCSRMPFEAKHNPSKRLSSIVCVLKISAKLWCRRQLRQCVHAAAGNSTAYKISVYQVLVKTVDDVILSTVQGLQRYDDISHATCVSVCGTEYIKNMVIVLGADDEPDFWQITRYLIVSDRVLYVVCVDFIFACICCSSV